MHDNCCASWHRDFVGGKCVDSILVDDITVAHNGVGRFRQFHRALLIVAVEDNYYIIPLVAHLIKVLKAVNYQAITSRQELKMLAHEVGTTQTEPLVMLAHRYEVLVIVKHLRVLDASVPVETIYAVGTLEAVVHALLVTQQLLTAEHERNAL